MPAWLACSAFSRVPEKSVGPFYVQMGRMTCAEAEQLITHWKAFDESNTNTSVNLISLECVKLAGLYIKALRGASQRWPSRSGPAVRLMVSLSRRWWQQWCRFSGFTTDGEGRAHYEASTGHPRPGPIDNTVLIDQTESPASICPLKPGLREGVPTS